ESGRSVSRRAIGSHRTGGGGTPHAAEAVARARIAADGAADDFGRHASAGALLANVGHAVRVPGGRVLPAGRPADSRPRPLRGLPAARGWNWYRASVLAPLAVRPASSAADRSAAPRGPGHRRLGRSNAGPGGGAPERGGGLVGPDRARCQCVL